jgi:hypothetical protein
MRWQIIIGVKARHFNRVAKTAISNNLQPD